LTLKNRENLKKYIISIFRLEKKNLASINYIFTNDRGILDINRRYLNHDFLTDIITFELSGKNQPIISEVYISVERVKENAAIHNTTFKEEIHRVIFHGILHLCGFNDKLKKQAQIMRAKETYYLSKYFS